MSLRAKFLAFLIAVVLFSVHLDAAQSVRTQHGMVVAAESLAAQAGVDVLKRGGNAIDAAVAVGFALAVTYPEAGNIGGGGFMLIRLANGTSTMIDFREKAPRMASRTMYLDKRGNPIEHQTLYGPLAAGVPGTVAGLLRALERHGTMKRTDVLDPAIMLAERGLRVDERLAESFAKNLTEFRGFSSTKRAFTRKGKAYRAGDVFRQPELARTLKAVSANGGEGFYSGRTADLIVAEMRRSRGIISRSDLAGYRAIERRPLVGSYRGYAVISASPPSAGGIVLLQMLNMLEQFDLKRGGSLSVETIHLIAGAGQRAFADRAEYPGDPDFVSIPVQRLISKSYAEERFRTFDSARAIPSARIKPGDVGDPGQQHTTHYCVADRFGNVVSTTVTLNGYYGCKTVVGGAGFFLNNEMDDFAVKAGVANMFGLVGGDANAIAPGKRMLSSMTPTIVLKDGNPFIVVGARGGSRITTAVLQIIVNVVDFDMNIFDAVNTPRVHHQWLPDTLLYEAAALRPGVNERLLQMGYHVREAVEGSGRAQAMLIDGGWFCGGPDLREQGVALGY